MTRLERTIAGTTIALAVIVDTAIAVGLATGLALPASDETKAPVRSGGAVSPAIARPAGSMSACTPIALRGPASAWRLRDGVRDRDPKPTFVVVPPNGGKRS